MAFLQNWLQEWTDACVYANECWPPLPLPQLREPYTALLSIAAACFLFWAFNERRGEQRRSAAHDANAAMNELNAILGQMKADAEPAGPRAA